MECKGGEKVQKKRVKRENFLKSTDSNSTKGDSYLDPVASQSVGFERRLSQHELDIVYFDYGFNKRLIEEIAGDSLKASFKVLTGDEELDQKLMKRVEELEIKDYLVDLLKYGLKDGIAFMFPILKGYNLETGQKLEDKKIDKIVGFNIFEARDIISLDRQMDKLLAKYGTIKLAEFKNPYGTPSSVKIDSSWLTIYEPIARYDRYTSSSIEYGDSFLKSLWDSLTIKDNAAWSVGQVAYTLLLKVLKIGSQDVLNKIKQKSNFRTKKEMELNSSTLAIIGKDDELELLGNMQGLKITELKDYVFSELSANTGIPVSKLLGSASGALASAEEDSKRWYEYIEKFQTDHLDELIRQVVKLLLAEEKREDIEFKIEFNSLRTMSDLEMAEYEKLKSETLKNKIDTIINLSRQVEGIEISADEFKNIRDELLRDIKADLGE